MINFVVTKTDLVAQLGETYYPAAYLHAVIDDRFSCYTYA